MSDAPEISIEDFDSARAELETLSWRSALVGLAPEQRDWLGHAPSNADWVFAWGVIECYARGVLTPYAWERSLHLDASLRLQAESWLHHSRSEDFFSTPPNDVKAEFAAWMRDVIGRTSRNYRLWQQVAWHLVQRHSESGLVDKVPPEVLRLVDYRSPIDSDHYTRVSHLMLGHGSSDHTAVQPSERPGRVLLLKIDFGDDIFAGSEGAMHFWIRPEDLAARNFDAVELTC